MALSAAPLVWLIGIVAFTIGSVAVITPVDMHIYGDVAAMAALVAVVFIGNDRPADDSAKDSHGDIAVVVSPPIASSPLKDGSKRLV